MALVFRHAIIYYSSKHDEFDDAHPFRAGKQEKVTIIHGE